LNNAQAGFLYSGPLSDTVGPPTRPYLPYWLPPGVSSIRNSGDGNTGGFAGSWDYASYGELGIVGGAGTLNYIPKWNVSTGATGKDTTIGNSSITDDGDTIRTSEPINLKCLTESGTSLKSDYTFMNFIDNAGVTRGSIEGQDMNDLTSDATYQANEGAFIGNTVLSAVQILTAVAQGIFAIMSAADVVACAAGLFTIPAIPTATTQLFDLITLVISTVAEVGALISTIVAYVIANSEQISNLGVQYSSSGADYAEFLKREHPNDSFYPGDIVGVRNGLISKNTDGAQSVLTISTAPIVLGNQPSKDEINGYEKVGFLGQVPVKVRGVVHPGDFIMASGLNDGVGIAVSAEQITPQQFPAVLGRAWTSSEGEGINLVKVAIGLSASDMSGIASREQAEIDSLKSKSAADNAAMNARLDKLELAIAQPDSAKRQAMLIQAQQMTKLSSAFGGSPGNLIQQQPQQLAQAPQQGTAKLSANQHPTPGPETVANTEQFITNSANKLLSSGQWHAMIVDKMKQLKSYQNVQQLMHSNIKAILATSDTPKAKGEKIRQYLTAPDPATRQAFGACALESIPLMKTAYTSTTVGAPAR
jgi:hypothetical protein